MVSNIDGNFIKNKVLMKIGLDIFDRNIIDGNIIKNKLLSIEIRFWWKWD